MTNATFGPMSSAPFATWDRDSRSWKTSEDTCLWALTLSSLTLPTSGGLRNGSLFERLTPGPVTSGHDSSSLPTPRTSDTNGSGAHGDGGPDLRTAVTFLPTPEAHQSGSTPESHLARKPGRKKVTALNIVAEYELLPTPAVNDMGEGKTLEWWDDWAPRQKAADGRPAPHGRSLAIEAQRMLPTPKATNNENRQSLDRYGMNLGMALESIGAITDPQLPDGKPSSDDPHQPQLSLDELAIPA